MKQETSKQIRDHLVSANWFLVTFENILAERCGI